MNTRDAAKKVLKEAGIPLHIEEITKQILQSDLCPRLQGETPSATVAASIYVDIKKNDTKSDFIKHGKSWFSFRKNEFQENETQSTLELKDKIKPLEELSVNSLLDFVVEILDVYGNKSPMHYRDIVNKMERENYSKKLGLNSGMSVESEILSEIDSCRESGNLGRFFTVGNGYFGLFKWSEFDLNTYLNTKNIEVKERLRYQLENLTAEQFEKLVGCLFSKMGYEVELTKFTNDRGIDVRAKPKKAKLNQVKLAIQVKKQKSKVHSPVIQQVRGSVNAHEQAVIVALSDFSPGARKEAQDPKLNLVELMNGEQFIERLIENKIGVRYTKLEILELSELPDLS